MRVRLLDQPRSEQLGKELQRLLRSKETKRLWVASAWVRRASLSIIEKDLRAFSARVKRADCRALFGVDLGGTTQEGLELALQLFGETRVFHPGGRRTFHPKLYLVEQEARAFVSIGSSNLTYGGLWNNFEVDVLLDLDLEDPDDAGFRDEVRVWYEGLWGHRQGAKRVTATSIEALAKDPKVRLPREREARKVLAGSSPASVPKGRSVFPKTVTGLKKSPPVPKTSDGGSEPVEDLPSEFVAGVPLDELKAAKSKDDLPVVLAGMAKERWPQAGFNREIAEQFFLVFENGDALMLQGVTQAGNVGETKESQLVFPKGSNQNRRIEFPEPDGRDDPDPDRAILVVLKVGLRKFRYMSLRPGDTGYEEIQKEIRVRGAFGTHLKPETKRVLITCGELQSVWPGPCPLQP